MSRKNSRNYRHKNFKNKLNSPSAVLRATEKQVDAILSLNRKLGREYTKTGMLRIGRDLDPNDDLLHVARELSRKEASSIIGFLIGMSKGVAPSNGIDGGVKSSIERNKGNDKSFVYFVSDGFGRVKIGVTTNIKKRMSGLQVGNAGELKLEAAISGTEETEKLLHKKFKKLKLTGEWFSFTPQLKNFIANLQDEGFTVHGGSMVAMKDNNLAKNHTITFVDPKTL